MEDVRPAFLTTDRKRETERDESKESRIVMPSALIKNVGGDSRYRELEEGYERKLKLVTK